MLTGRYVGHEGVPAIVTVDGSTEIPTAHTDGHEVTLTWCGGGRFLAFDKEDPSILRRRLEFFFRDGQAWGLRVGTRIFHREDL